MTIRMLLLGSLAGLSLLSAAAAQKPGEVFREYTWRPSKWQRCTGADASAKDARQFLPNPVNRIRIGDLQHAVRAEVQIEKLTSHAGTMDPRVKVNGNAWMKIPDPDPNLIPGTRGKGRDIPQVYLTMRYPVVPVPLSQLKQGTNTFEFACRGAGGKLIGRLWPQWLCYGVIFRIYYDPAKKSHPTGTVNWPPRNTVVREKQTFSADAKGGAGIARVDFIGDHYDFEWRGDGVDGGWQYHFHYGQIRKHIGSATKSPWRVTWNNEWVPTQPGAFRVIARVVDKSGIVYITPIVDGLRLVRRKSVVRYRNVNIPVQWQTQFYTPYKWCDTHVNDDLTKAEAAKFFLTTWNGYEAWNIGINDNKVVTNIGKNHDLDYNTIDVPLKLIRSGYNWLYTRSSTKHHGIEVQWPGIELFVRYKVPEGVGEFVSYGKGCKGFAGLPILGMHGRPLLGGAYNIGVGGVAPSQPVALVTGLSQQSIPLARGGAPGCTLLASLDLPIVLTLGASNGIAWFPTGIPNIWDLNGLRLFQQAAVWDPITNSMKLVFSNGGRTTIGAR